MKKYNYKLNHLYINLFILFVIIFIIFIIFYYKFYKKNNYITEHYLTYFLPFNEGNQEKIDLYNFYSEKLNESLYFKSKLDYNKIKIGIALGSPFSEYMLKVFLGNTNLMFGDSIKYPNRVIGVDKLLSNDINILLSDDFTLYHCKYILNKDVSNLRLITYLNKEFLYFIVKKQSNIFSLNDFPPGSIIGINGEPNSLHYYIDKILKDMNYQKDVDYVIKIYSDYNSLFNDFKLSNIDIIILLDTFPSNKINDIVHKSISNEILLLPFDIPNEKVFFQKNRFLNIDYVDLNLFADNYLPKHFGKYHYNKNLPTLKMCYLKKSLLTNNLFDNKFGYNIIKYYDENVDYLNQLFNDPGYKLDKYYFDINSPITYHRGVLEYLIHKGYSTNIDNPNCKYLVGVMECNEENLKNNNLYL